MTTLLWPNGQAVEPARSDGYGPRRSILTDAGWTRPFHVGTDHYGLGIIRSPGAGTVVESEWSRWAGWQVLIDLGVIDGRRTWVRLCHLAAPSPLRPGDQVTRGGLVGTEGATGQTAGRHLHWEVYIGRVDRGSGSDPGTTVDPRAFIISHLPGTGTPAGTIRDEETSMSAAEVKEIKEHARVLAAGVPGNGARLTRYARSDKTGRVYALYENGVGARWRVEVTNVDDLADLADVAPRAQAELWAYTEWPSDGVLHRPGTLTGYARSDKTGSCFALYVDDRGNRVRRLVPEDQAPADIPTWPQRELWSYAATNQP